ncbi:unnamed protein product [Porites lobata]|uniref:Uncharacterized protein n=1 Tax=Porites lobata TaxID=104759 RepID=A0ABN8PAL0_9CNID|nr:unnamed protein product [Porites lobata]
MFISAECRIEVCMGYIHDSNPNWRKDVQEEILNEDDILDPELKQSVIKTVSNAEDIAEQLKDFAQFVGH